MHRLILFTSFYFATKFDKILSEMGILHALIATPPSLDSACGLCIRLEAAEFDEAVELIKKRNISHSGLYRSEDGQTWVHI